MCGFHLSLLIASPATHYKFLLKGFYSKSILCQYTCEENQPWSYIDFQKGINSSQKIKARGYLRRSELYLYPSVIKLNRQNDSWLNVIVSCSRKPTPVAWNHMLINIAPASLWRQQFLLREFLSTQTFKDLYHIKTPFQKVSNGPLDNFLAKESWVALWSNSVPIFDRERIQPSRKRMVQQQVTHPVLVIK